MGRTKLRLKFGKKYYRFHVSFPTKWLAEREVKTLRTHGYAAQFVKRKDSNYPNSTVYRVYKRRK